MLIRFVLPAFSFKYLPVNFVEIIENNDNILHFKQRENLKKKGFAFFPHNRTDIVYIIQQKNNLWRLELMEYKLLMDIAIQKQSN